MRLGTKIENDLAPDKSTEAASTGLNISEHLIRIPIQSAMFLKSSRLRIKRRYLKRLATLQNSQSASCCMYHCRFTRAEHLPAAVLDSWRTRSRCPRRCGDLYI